MRSVSQRIRLISHIIIDSSQLMTLKIGSLKEISNKYSSYFFDLDGVIWRGSQQIKGGVEALHFLRQNQKRIFFITNSSTRNREMLCQRFKDFGFEAHMDEIYPSDYITSLYLKATYPQINKIMVIGKESLAEQIKAIGKDVWHLNNKDILNQITEVPELIKKIDKTVGAVVFGYDFQINYSKICLASFHIQHGAKFIGTNPDQYTIIAGYKLPGNGSMISCVELASGVKAQIAGKPNPFILQYLIKQHQLQKQGCLMIGDNLDTDIRFGTNGGIDTLCVLTGNATEQMVQKAGIATYYCQYLY